MCLGIPMQVLAVSGHFALCSGRDERRQVSTLLVGDVQPGDWLLVFIQDARERISAQRAAEVNAALDLVCSALHGDAPQAVDFGLPSQMTAEQLRALTGQ